MACSSRLSTAEYNIGVDDIVIERLYQILILREMTISLAWGSICGMLRQRISPIDWTRNDSWRCQLNSSWFVLYVWMICLFCYIMIKWDAVILLTQLGIGNEVVDATWMISIMIDMDHIDEIRIICLMSETYKEKWTTARARTTWFLCIWV